MHGVDKLSPQIGENVAIIGAGTIGLMMLKIIKARGAGNVVMIDIADYPLSMAKILGTERNSIQLIKILHFIRLTLKLQVADLIHGRMFDRVIVPTGAVPAMGQALNLSGKHSTIVLFGLPSADAKLEIPVLETLTKEKTIRFSWLAPLVWQR